MRREVTPVWVNAVAFFVLAAAVIVVTAILATTAGFYWELGKRAASALTGGPPIVTHRHAVEPGRRLAVTPAPKEIRERLTESDSVSRSESGTRGSTR